MQNGKQVEAAILKHGSGLGRITLQSCPSQKGSLFLQNFQLNISLWESLQSLRHPRSVMWYNMVVRTRCWNMTDRNKS